MVFVCGSYILQPCWTHILVLGVILSSLWNFPYGQSCHLQIETDVVPPFWFVWLLLHSRSLLTLARTTGTLLNSSGESRHPCLVSDRGEKASGLSPLSIMLAVEFVDALHQVDEGSCLHSLTFMRVLFLLWLGVEFVRYFFHINWYNHVVFLF